LFNWLQGKKYWVVVSVFDNMDRLGTSIVGEENPWGDRPHPLLPSVVIDSVFLIQAKPKYLGHIKCCSEQGVAEFWAKSISDATTVWACWDMGYPVGPFGTDDQYQRAKRGAEKSVIFEVRGASPRTAASKALELFKSDYSRHST
jgi:hypothetical protein